MAHELRRLLNNLSSQTQVAQFGGSYRKCAGVGLAYHHERDVQRDANGEGLVEVGRCMGVCLPVVVFAQCDALLQPTCLRTRTPLRSVPGATVLKTVPYFFTFSCSKLRRWSVSSVSTMIS